VARMSDVRHVWRRERRRTGMAVAVGVGGDGQWAHAAQRAGGASPAATCVIAGRWPASSLLAGGGGELGMTRALAVGRRQPTAATSDAMPALLARSGPAGCRPSSKAKPLRR
jgi:hypothetical protein